MKYFLLLLCISSGLITACSRPCVQYEDDVAVSSTNVLVAWGSPQVTSAPGIYVWLCGIDGQVLTNQTSTQRMTFAVSSVEMGPVFLRMRRMVTGTTVHLRSLAGLSGFSSGNGWRDDNANTCRYLLLGEYGTSDSDIMRQYEFGDDLIITQPCSLRLPAAGRVEMEFAISGFKMGHTNMFHARLRHEVLIEVDGLGRISVTNRTDTARRCQIMAE